MKLPGVAALLAIALTVAVSLAGCATTPHFEAVTAARDQVGIEAALTDAGLTVCDRRPGDDELPGAVDTESLTVSATSCPSGDRVGDDAGSTGVVQVVMYESKAARDAGARNVYLHGRLRPASVATTYGAATVRLAGGANGEVRERYEKAVDRLDS